MFKKILFLLLVLIVIGVGVVAYWGFVPGLSALIGSTTPRDLHVVSSPEALASAEKKSGVHFVSAPASQTQSIVFSGVKSGSASFSGEELTSVVQQSHWKDFPVDQFQTRFNTDGSVELSGKLIVSKVPSYLAAHGFNTGGIQPYLDKVSALGINPPIYLKYTSSWSNNRISIQPQIIEIGRYRISPDQYQQHQTEIVGGIESLVQSVPNLSIQSLTFSNGMMNATGSFPATVSMQQ